MTNDPKIDHVLFREATARFGRALSRCPAIVTPSVCAAIDEMLYNLENGPISARVVCAFFNKVWEDSRMKNLSGLQTEMDSCEIRDDQRRDIEAEADLSFLSDEGMKEIIAAAMEDAKGQA